MSEIEDIHNPDLDPVDQALLVDLDTLDHLASTVGVFVAKTARTPTDKNINHLEETIGYTVTLAGQVIDNVMSRSTEPADKATKLAQIFSNTRRARLKQLFGPDADLESDYTSSLSRAFHNAFANEDEGMIVDDDGEFYNISELAIEQFRSDLLNDIQQYLDPRKDGLRYKAILAYEQNKQIMFASGIGAFVGVVAAKAIFRR